MIGIKDFLNYASLGELSVSPGERFAAYEVKQAVLEGNRYTREVWVYDLETGENHRLLRDGEITGNLSWESDTSLLYLRQEENTSLLYRVDVAAGEKTLAAWLPQGADNAWKLGERLVFSRQEGPQPECYPEELEFLAQYQAGFETVDEIPMWDNGRGFVSGKRTALYDFSPDGTAHRLTDEDTTVDAVRQEKGCLVYTARTYRGRSTEPGLYLLGEKGMSELVVPQGRYRISNFALDDSRKRVWFTAQDKTIHTMTSDSGFYAGEDGRVTKLPVSDRSAGNSVSMDVEYGASEHFTVSDGWIYYTATRNWSSRVERVRTDGTMTQSITPEGGGVYGFSRLGDGRILFIGIRNMELQELWLWHQGALTRLTAHNTGLDPKEVIVPQRFSFRQFGFDVNYVVLPPANFDPQKRYPAVLYIHGGAKVLYTDVFFHEMQYLASCGYYVIYGNPHGSDGQGSEFADLLGHYGQKDFADLMKAVDIALERYPNIDPERLGVAGGSYGGIMTNWCVTHTDRFKCGIAQRSICNMMSTFGTADNGFGFVREQMDGDLWNGADKLWEQSPLKYANNCHTPLLLIHSDEDHRCDYSEAVQMFTALKYLGVESKLVLIRGENHSLSRCGRPVQRMKRLYEIRKWLDEHLGNP